MLHPNKIIQPSCAKSNKSNKSTQREEKNKMKLTHEKKDGLLVTRIPNNQILLRGVNEREHPCDLEPRLAWFSLSPNTAKLYAKPHLCSYCIKKPNDLFTMDLSPENMGILFDSLEDKDQWKENLVFGFGYDPRLKKNLTCPEMLHHIEDKKVRVSKERMTEFKDQKFIASPAGRCSITDHDKYLMRRFCAWKRKYRPWLDGYSSSSLPSTFHKGKFHDELMLCDPTEVVEPEILIRLYQPGDRVTGQSPHPIEMIGTRNLTIKQILQEAKLHPDSIVSFRDRRINTDTKLQSLPLAEKKHQKSPVVVPEYNLFVTPRPSLKGVKVMLHLLVQEQPSKPPVDHGTTELIVEPDTTIQELAHMKNLSGIKMTAVYQGKVWDNHIQLIDLPQPDSGLYLIKIVFKM
jgi:hypothetical protein